MKSLLVAVSGLILLGYVLWHFENPENSALYESQMAAYYEVCAQLPAWLFERTCDAWQFRLGKGFLVLGAAPDPAALVQYRIAVVVPLAVSAGFGLLAIVTAVVLFRFGVALSALGYFWALALKYKDSYEFACQFIEQRDVLEREATAQKMELLCLGEWVKEHTAEIEALNVRIAEKHEEMAAIEERIKRLKDL